MQLLTRRATSISLSGYVGRRWYDRLKKFATVFYGWLLWAKLNSLYAPAQTGAKGNAVLGAGREIFAPLDFDTTHPVVRQAMDVYTKLSGSVRAAGAQLLVVYIPLSYAIHERTRSAGAISVYGISPSRWFSMLHLSVISINLRSPVLISPNICRSPQKWGRGSTFGWTFTGQLLATPRRHGPSPTTSRVRP